MKINAKVMKPLLLSAAAIMLVIATVFATMAYMTSSAAVSNVFTIGNVKLHMYETKVKPDGTPVEAILDGAMKNTDTNSYHLLPGKSYLKDPTIYVDAGSDECYLFIRLRNDLKSIEKQDQNDEHLTILEQLRKNGWLEIERAESNVDAVFVYVGNDRDLTAEINSVDTTDCATEAEKTQKVLNELSNIPAKIVGGVGVREDIKVFEEFTLADEVEGLERFGGARVAIVAYAIQADGVSAEEDIGKYDSYMKAWDYVKAELPFVV